MLALWEYFWDWGGAAPVTPAASTELAPDGGSKKKKHATYIPASEDFWDARARYLNELQAPSPKTLAEFPKPVSGIEPSTKVIKAYQALPRLTAEHRVQLNTFQLADTLPKLHAAGQRLLELDRIIRAAHQYQLFLAAKERKAKRRSLITKKKRKAKLLAAALAVLKLFT